MAVETSERLWSPDELGVAYTDHVIVAVEPMGGVRHLEAPDGKKYDLILRHNEDISASMGEVIACGERAAAILRDGPGADVLYEPNSDTLVIPKRYSTTGQTLVVVSVHDVMGIILRPSPEGHLP